MWGVILLAMSAPADAAKLGADEFTEREDAHARLRAAGLLAVPALLASRESDDPEIRFRVGVLLRGWREFAADERARAVLYSPWPVDPQRFYADRRLRERIRRLAQARGVTWWDAGLVPDDDFNEFQSGRKDTDAAEALDRCRRALGVEPVGWPFN